MGYYTNYTLEIYEGERKISAVLEEIFEADICEGLNYVVNCDGESIDSTKWYDHETDMKSISRRYPDVVFLLKGEGEEAGDVWKKYFKNGKMQSCPAVITFVAYDEGKLE